jgi:phosphatidylglycerophosphate synthase
MSRKFSQLWDTKNKDDEWWSSFVTAPLGVLFNYVIIDIKWITPNFVTGLSFAAALLSAWFIIRGGSNNFVVAAILIHLSHVLDCMDGQMARYRRMSTASGSYFDRISDQLQIIIWFVAVAYVEYLQSHNILPIFLAFIGVAFYSMRGYAKYVAIHVEMIRNSEYLKVMEHLAQRNRTPIKAGYGFGFQANCKWFIAEQRKVLLFNEGVFIFMLSLALILDQLTLMLWVFSITQLFFGVYRGWEHGRKIDLNQNSSIKK